MKIVLSMIVKNEAKVIERCLNSVLPFIDAFAIVDTGSIDGTQLRIKNILQGKGLYVPGRVENREWVDFATNRQQALELARAVGSEWPKPKEEIYALFIDADEVFEYSSKDEVFALHGYPGYMLKYIFGSTSYKRIGLARLDLDWQWKGVLHEAINPPYAVATPLLEGCTVKVYSDGARSNQDVKEKFLSDACVLRQALDVEPDNARYYFYLAQSLRDAGQLEQAVCVYKDRIKMGGWDEEIYYSYLQNAVINERIHTLDKDFDFVLSSYLAAYNYRPTRAESLCELARYCRLNYRFNLAYLFASKAAQTQTPNDLLFVDESVYAWRALDELAVAAYYVGNYLESGRLCRQLLNNELLPKDQKARIRRNKQFANSKLGEKSEH
jgi:glycosyltransferase involved in cell wall biosynthesis